MRAPNAPRVASQAPQSPGFSASPSTPFQDSSGKQLQQVGGAVEKAGQQALRVQSVLQERLNVSRVKQGSVKLSEAYRKLLRSQEGYLHTTGDGAIDGRDSIAEQIEQERQKIANGLDNDDQRAVFMNATAADRERALTVVDGHYVGQLKANEVEQTAARATMKSADAVDIYMESGANDAFDEAQAAVFGPDGELNQLLDAQGVTGDARTLATMQAKDSFAAALVSRLNDDGNSTEAGEVITALAEAGDLSKGAAAELRETVRHADVQEKSQQISFDLREKFPDLRSQFGELEKRWASGKISVEERDATMTRLQRVSALEYGATQKERNTVLKDAQNWATLNRSSGDMTDVLIRSSMHKRLKDVGMLDDFRIWDLNGGQWVTTERGRRAMLTMTQERLKDYASAEDLDNAWRTELDDVRLSQLHKMRVEALKPGKMVDAISIGLGEQVLGILKKNGTLSATATLDDTDALAMVDTWVSAITEDVNANITDRKALSGDIAESYEKLRGIGVIGDTPLSQLTPDQKQSGVFQIDYNGERRTVDLATMAQQPGIPSFDEMVELLEEEGHEPTLDNIGLRFLIEIDAKNAGAAEDKAAATEKKEHEALTGVVQSMRRAQDDYTRLFEKEMRITQYSTDQRRNAHIRAMKRMWNDNGADLKSAGVNLEEFLTGIENSYTGGAALTVPTIEELRVQKEAAKRLPAAPKFGSIGGVRY